VIKTNAGPLHCENTHSKPAQFLKTCKLPVGVTSLYFTNYWSTLPTVHFLKHQANNWHKQILPASGVTVPYTEDNSPDDPSLFQLSPQRKRNDCWGIVRTILKLTLKTSEISKLLHKYKKIWNFISCHILEGESSNGMACHNQSSAVKISMEHSDYLYYLISQLITK